MMKLILFTFLLVVVHSTMAQFDAYYEDNYMRYDDYTYSEDYKSVQLFKTGLQLSRPIIQLGTNEKLTLAFDDLTVGSQTYYYTFILCNNDWTPADMLPMEYIDGMHEEFFNNNSVSFNTTTRYSHYRVQFPSSNMKITKSGNYLLKVYPEGDPDSPVITRRFYVVENKVEIDAEYRLANAPQYRYSHQEFFVKVNLLNYQMPNIYEDFTLVVQKNGRKDNVVVRHRPKIISNEYLYFNLTNDILFNGGNEYRSLDLRSLKVNSARVQSIEYDSAGYHVDVATDFSRDRKSYIKYSDLNGMYSVITWEDAQLSHQIEADYAMVNFSYFSDTIIEHGGIYLVGALTDWRIDENSRMAYDRHEKKYTNSLLLKQGYYDYQYVYVSNGSTVGDASLFEGNHSATVNDYYVFVYYRDMGQNWDRLIGFQTKRSNL